MSTPSNSIAAKKPWQLSLDSWAVLAALAFAILIRFGVLKVVPW